MDRTNQQTSLDARPYLRKVLARLATDHHRRTKHLPSQLDTVSCDNLNLAQHFLPRYREHCLDPHEMFLANELQAAIGDVRNELSNTDDPKKERKRRILACL